VFTRDGRDGTFPLSLVGLEGPRAPDVVFSFAWSDESVNGIAGTAVGAESKLVMDHGSISPYDLHNTLVMQGPELRVGWRDPLPVGNIDICPTLTHVLQLDSGSTMDGRVLSEALGSVKDGSLEWETVERMQTFGARGRFWRQRLWFDSVAASAYLAGGTVEPV
jgi:hypothetical protein